LNLLLDGNALLWWQADDTRLGGPTRRALEDPAGGEVRR
jgi:PIN domain nuclease of toxin-antitoxin system